MMIRMRLGLMKLAAALTVIAMAVPAWADDDTASLDARLLGYKNDVYSSPGSTMTLWLIVIALGAVGLGVLFMSARRSHLD